jgi:hypothetical protein
MHHDNHAGGQYCNSKANVVSFRNKFRKQKEV